MLYEEFRRVSNGTGFPRCVERLGRQEATEASAKAAHKRLDDIAAKLWWAFGLIAAQVVILAFQILKGKLGI